MVTLAVNEIFGPTLQGEGRSLGRPAAFLRVAACNLACVWCDTAYTWDWSRFDKAAEVHLMAPEEVAAQVLAHLPPLDTGPLLVITGGEPMLQQVALGQVLQLLPDLDVEVETAGTVAPQPTLARHRVRYNVSLKLAHSGNVPEKRERPAAIAALAATGRAAWKFVVQQPSDLAEVDALVAEYHLAPVYIMPEGTDPAVLRERARLLAEPVISRGYRLTGRLHIDLWGTERGH